MQRRNFLKAVLGLAAVPVAGKVVVETVKQSKPVIYDADRIFSPNWKSFPGEMKGPKIEHVPMEALADGLKGSNVVKTTSSVGFTTTGSKDLIQGIHSNLIKMQERQSAIYRKMLDEMIQ